MKRAVLLAAIALGIAPATAHADAVCAKTEKTISAWFRGIDAVGREGLDLTAKCMFNGTNDKALDNLAPKIKKAFRPPVPGCDSASIP